MNLEREHRQKVVEYYNITQWFYKHFWHGKSGGLHYGLWTKDVKNRQQAIIKENEVLANLAEVKINDLVLDVGCGIGGSGVWLAKKKDAEVVGLNIVHKQLTIGEKLRNKNNLLKQKLDFVEADFQELPFVSDVFDVFWCLESIEHATNIERFIQEAHRVLKPGGRMVVAATFLGRENLSDEEKRQMAVGGGVAGCFNDFRTAEAVSKIMQNKGFADVRNLEFTKYVMRSAREMTAMCKLGLPVAKVLSALHITSPLLIPNNEWGIYQEGLFRSGTTSYNVLVAGKPCN